MNIVSSPRIVEVEFHRIKTDACKLEFLLFEAGEPMEEVPTSKLIFRNANTVVLELTPSVTDNRLTFLVDQEGKAKLNKEQNQLFLLLDGKTVARGKLIWDIIKSPVGLVEAPAIQLNFTTEGSITGTTILQGPRGLSAYEYAVTKGYSGTEEDFAADQANFAATAAEVKADKEDALLAQSAAESARDTAVGARNEAVDARNEAVPAASDAISAKDDAEDARDIAVQAKDDAEAARDIAVLAKEDAVEARDEAVLAKEAAELAASTIDGSGEVQEGEVKLVSGGKVFEALAFLREITYTSPQLFDNATMQSGNYSNTTGAPQENNNHIRTPLIELKDGEEKISISGHGTISTSAHRVYFYGEGQTFISSEEGSEPTPYTFNIPAGAKYAAFRVANVAGIGLNPTESDFQYVMINYGDPEEFQPFLPPSLDGKKIVNLRKYYPEGFFELKVDGSPNGKARIRFFSKLKNTEDIYVGFFIDHFQNTSDEVYVDVFRLVSAELFIFNGKTMVSLGKNIISVGENECVYRCQGRSDFTGGFHGDEMLTSVEFFVDGVEISIEENIPLSPCTVFSYRQISTMHESAATGGIVNLSHPVEAIHHKITTFQNASYTTRNRLIWQEDDIPVNLWYFAISCIGKNTSHFVSNEYLEKEEMISDQQEKLNSTLAKQYFGTNSATKLSSFATSKLIKPAFFFDEGGVVSADDTCTMFVWDRMTDSKYYRRYTPAAAPKKNDIWESEMTVSFSYNTN